MFVIFEIFFTNAQFQKLENIPQIFSSFLQPYASHGAMRKDEDDDFSSFGWRIFSHTRHLDQSHASTIDI